MRERITGLNLKQLRIALQQAALPAEQQIARLAGFDAAFEIADDLDNWCSWALASTDLNLTEQQRSRLGALNRRLKEMSGEHNAHCGLSTPFGVGLNGKQFGARPGRFWNCSNGQLRSRTTRASKRFDPNPNLLFRDYLKTAMRCSGGGRGGTTAEHMPTGSAQGN